MHVACPKCGTGYALDAEVLAKSTLKLRCRHCATVWNPREPLAAFDAALAKAIGAAADDAGAPEAADTPASTPETSDASAPPPPPAPETTDANGDAKAKAKGKGRRLVLASVYALALLMTIGGLAGVGYAFKDQIPGFGAPMPELVDVQPEWRDGDHGRHLVVTAKVVNPSAGDAEVRHIHVKFLSQHGAWIGERLVTVPEIVVHSMSDAMIEVGVDDLPDGTVSLELSLVAADAHS